MEEDKKNFVKVLLLVLLVLALVFGGGFLACNLILKFAPKALRTSPNTRETADLMTAGEWGGESIKADQDHWLYFDLDETTVVALGYYDDWAVATYFYNEAEAMAAPYFVSPEIEPDPGDPDENEPNRLYGNGFETRELAAGRYYFRLHVIQGGMFGRRVASAMYMIVEDLPALPTGAEQVVAVASEVYAVTLESGYYTLGLTEERSDFTADTFMPDHVTLYLDFYYGENNSRHESLYFHHDKFNESLQTFTLPAGRTIVQVDTRVKDEYGGSQPNATVKFTVVKAAPGTVFDREVSALPELPLGRELNLSEMFDLEAGSTGVLLHGLNSMRIDLTENSVFSVRIKGYPDSSSLTVVGYYNTDPLNSYKRQSGSVIFSALQHHDDKELSFELPAGLNLIEVRVNLDLVYPEEVFAASTIEFNISPVETTDSDIENIRANY